MKWFAHKKGPPRISRWLLNKTFCRDTDTAAGDFEEVFHQIKKQRGATMARMWYRAQVLLSLFPYLLCTIKWRLEMIKNYFKSIFRTIKKHKTFSLINILGLTLALSCMIFLWLYISHENSYDKYHPDVEWLYRISLVKTDKMVDTRYAAISWAAGTILKKDFPQVAHLARLGELNDPMVSYLDKKFYEKRVFYAEPAIFKIFPNSFLRGNPNTALNDTHSLVLTRKMEKKYFGQQQALGKILRIGNKPYRVTGVVADCPSNTHWKYNMIVSAASYYDKNWEKDWFSTQYHTYLRLHPSTDVAAFARQIRPLRDLHVGKPAKKYGKSYGFETVPVHKIHLTSNYRFEIESSGNPTYIILFSIIAIFILIIAAINYINLSTARSLNRAKEVGIRKVAGAQQSQLVWQFLSESLVVAFISLCNALLLAILLLPTFNLLSGINVDTATLLQFNNLIFLLTATIIFALVAGIFPAISLSSISPSLILQRLTPKKSPRFWLRKILVLGQFSISIALIIMTITIFKQVNFMKNQDMGFDKQQKLCLQVRGGSFSRGLALSTNFKSIKNEFLKIPGVKSATASSSVPGTPLSNFSLSLLNSATAKSLSMYHMYVDHEFISMFQLKQIAGKNFIINKTSDFGKNKSRSGFILNRAAVEALGFETVDRALSVRVQSGLRGRTGPIIGVVENFHFRGLQQPVEPLVFEYMPHLFDTVTLKVDSSDVGGLMDRIRSKWLQLYPELPIEYFFLDENFNRFYHSEIRMGELVAIFSMLGLTIACMGLWGMALFTAENRTKEMGIRKVLGASGYKIISLLFKDFIQIILLANLLSWPISYWLANRWLTDFAKRIDLGIDIFIIAGCLALLIALATISYQSIKVALADPMNSIKYE